jgi:hypothetical protein
VLSIAYTSWEHSSAVTHAVLYLQRISLLPLCTHLQLLSTLTRVLLLLHSVVCPATCHTCSLNFCLHLIICTVIDALLQDWPLRWSDEFTNPVLDLNKWGYSIGNACDLGFCGWGNNEQQVYDSKWYHSMLRISLHCMLMQWM